MPAKKVVQDIVPSERRTIRNIPVRVMPTEPTPPRKTRTRIPKEETPVIHIEEDEIVPPPPLTRRPRGGSSGKKVILSFAIILICCGVIGFALSFLYSKAVVTITPQITELNVAGTFTAQKESANSVLIYEVVNVSNTRHESIPATAGPRIETKAKGTITLYNNYSATAQKIVAGTRLSDTEGYIYRTSSTVTIPGKKTVGGKVVPGSIAVPVIADAPGEGYNNTVAELKGDYKIVAYKGTPKYEGFYGRLKTDLSGGFSGNKMVIDPEVEKTAIASGEEALKADLLIELKNAVPENYILYDSAYVSSFTKGTASFKSTTTADIALQGTLQGIIFKRDALLKSIAGKEIQKFPSSTYKVEGMEDLNFSLLNTKDISLKKGTPVIFSLKGDMMIVGTFEEEELKKKLRGIALEDSNTVFAQYGAISNAYALITPFWLRHFPNTEERIILEYKSE